MKTQATKRNKIALRDGKLFLDTGDCCDLKYADDLKGIGIIFYKTADTIKLL